MEAPTVCVTLTTRDPDLPARLYRDGSHYVFKSLRRRFGRVEFFGAIEFTTGRARRSGGRRRMHGHYLVKGIHQADVLDAETIVRRCWSATTGAVVVEVAALVSPGAALGYLGLHHRKASQAPPAEWRGMTERSSRGYWSSPIGELRKRARAELAAEAHAWRTGLPLEVAALEVAARAPARLVEVRSLGGSDVLEPLGEFNGRLPDETRAAITAARKVRRRDGANNPDAQNDPSLRGSRLGAHEVGGVGVALGLPRPSADPTVSPSPSLPL